MINRKMVFCETLQRELTLQPSIEIDEKVVIEFSTFPVDLYYREDRVAQYKTNLVKDETIKIDLAGYFFSKINDQSLLFEKLFQIYGLNVFFTFPDLPNKRTPTEVILRGEPIVNINRADELPREHCSKYKYSLFVFSMENFGSSEPRYSARVESFSYGPNKYLMSYADCKRAVKYLSLLQKTFNQPYLYRIVPIVENWDFFLHD